jgi:hypothetical protein
MPPSRHGPFTWVQASRSRLGHVIQSDENTYTEWNLDSERD